MGWKLPTLLAALWVVALSVVGAAIGLLIAGPDGVLIGAIPLALGTVLAGYLPAIREAVHRRQDELARLEQAAAEAQERWDAVGEPRTETIGPAALLRPDQGIVQFTGREPELGVLRAWCASEDVRSVRTIIGAGGVGKTRLALRVASEWEARGDEWRRVDAGQEAQAVAAARGVTSGPVLLVVDYAETRTDLGAMLRAVLADPGPIRVLLVARSLGEWWDGLIERSASAVARLLRKAGPIRLAEQITQETSDADLVADAIPQFARTLKCATPERAEFELPAHRAPVLVLHTAALVAVLRFRDDPAASLRVVVADGVLDELLEHEARYWRRKAAGAGLPEDGALLKPVVAVAALLGAEDFAEAAEMVTRVPDLSDAFQAQRRSWARWLYELYPADPEGRLGSLQPDLLAETHVVNQLAAAPGLAQACMRDLPREQAERALTVLARAWAHQDAAQWLIAKALDADLDHLAVPAISVAAQTNPMLAELLGQSFEDQQVSRDTLASVVFRTRHPSATPTIEVLAAPSVAAFKRLADQSTDDGERADWLVDLSDFLARLERLGQALAAIEQAIGIYRTLAAARPDPFLPHLFASLNNQANLLADLGRPEEALAAAKEATRLYPKLSSIPFYRPRLANSLNNQANLLADLGRPEEALAAAKEATRLYRKIAKTAPDPYLMPLANALNNQANLLTGLGRPEEALAAAKEALAIRSKLAQPRSSSPS